MKKLTNEDADLYYKMWRPLLQYANRKWKLFPRINFATDPQIDIELTVQVAHKIWENKKVIDEYLRAAPDLPERERKIIASWKKAKHGLYAVVKFQDSGAILIDENDDAYNVLGLISTFDEMFRMVRLPVVVDATILPFEGKLVTDGLFFTVEFNAADRKKLKEAYSRVRRMNTIITSFPDDPQ